MKLKVVKEPKMTVNKLGEFLVAPPKRQRRILEQLKYPKDNAFSLVYSDVREVIKKYFISDFDEKILARGIKSNSAKLKDKKSTDWQKTVAVASIEALQKVQDFYFDISNLSFEEYTGKNPKVMIHGVEVSIMPDLIVKSSTKTKELIGSFKIHISKNSKSDENACLYVATLLHNYSIDQLEEIGITAKNENSISYDVFKEIFVESPKSFKRRMDDIEAGCMNIKAIWDSI